MAALDEAVRLERRSTSRVLRCLIEFERRSLLDRMPYPSLFEYCTHRLGYSEDEAFKRIRAARAAAEHKEILDLLDARKTDLSRVVVVSPHLKGPDAARLLECACFMSKRELEHLVAGYSPQPVPRDTIRPIRGLPGNNAPAHAPSALPSCYAASNEGDSQDGTGTCQAWVLSETDPADTASATGPAEVPGPAIPGPASGIPQDDLRPGADLDLVRISFTADRGTAMDLERACSLLRCRRSNIGPVVARALKTLLREIDPDQRAAEKERRRAITGSCTSPTPDKLEDAETRGIPDASGTQSIPEPSDPQHKHPDPASRHIPQKVRDEVWKRDEGRCSFHDLHGNRCTARAPLEFDHILPWSFGGKSDDPANIRLLCRHHNQAEARRWFGSDRVNAAIAARREETAASP
ncbi:MAG: HNH endonuclease signature motif containing protein [Elusimicrobiota bacterium]